ncbi:MAG: rhodanese-like domain-containing protein [Gemmatimonadota bacterium]|nr:rhodanese-like domain-containing protein [Gemmatimonadota bacterium]
MRLAVRLVRPVCLACMVCAVRLVCLVCAVCAVYTAFIPATALSAPAISAQEETEDNTVFWSTTLKMIRAKFPGVAQLSTDSLQTWLDEPGQAPTGRSQSDQAQTGQAQVGRPLLLDVREKEEYEVSHLKDAVRAASEQEALKALEGIPPDRPVVLYCSVGYRSSEMAGFLQKRGYEKVYNLEGSIFAWANEGKPVYRGEERVQVVHPYDRVWGKLLKKVLRAW